MNRESFINACSEGNIDAVREHLSKGFFARMFSSYNINVKNSDGDTPLILALRNSHHKLARLLIEKGADINIAGSEGMTPLMVAIRYHRWGILDILLDNQADLNAHNNFGHTALYYAISRRDYDLVKRLINMGADVNAAQNEYGETLLMYSTADNSVKISQELISNGADIHAVTTNGINALVGAAESGALSTAKLLIDEGAEINHVFEGDLLAQYTPLYIAARAGQTEIVELLLESGADIQLCMKLRASPLDIAIERKYPDVVELIKRKMEPAQPEAEDAKKPASAPANLFGAHTDVGVAKEYLVNNAQKAKDEGVYSVWSWVDSRSGTLFYQFFSNVSESNGFEFDSPSYVTEQTMLYEAGTMRVNGRELVDGPDWMKKDQLEKQKLEGGDMERQLSDAIHEEDVETVQLLLEQGADANALDANALFGSASLLQSAGKTGNIEIVKLLIQNGANVNYKNTEGFPLIALVAHWPGENTISIIQALIDAGADVYATNARGYTALDIIKSHIPEFSV